MTARKNNSNTRGSRNNGSTGIPAWFWLLGGILIGLGAAAVLMFRGYLPEFKEHAPAIDRPAESISSKALISEKDQAPEPEKPRFDFFTVLPEMEVVVPEQELQRQAQSKPVPEAATKTENGTDSESTSNQGAATTAASDERYILQVGSFQNASEAEQMKAQLALIGFSTSVQTVTVNGQSWHRIRVGPFEGAREAENMRQMLVDNHYKPLVMKAKP